MTALVTRRSARRRETQTLVLVTGVALLACLATGLVLVTYGGIRNWSAAGVLAAMGALSWVARVPEVRGGVYYSFLNIILLASVVILGPFGTAVVAALAPVWDRQRLPKRARVYNTAMNVLSALAASLVYLALGGLQAGRTREVDGVIPLLLHVGVPLLVADVVQAVTNVVLLGVVVSVSRGAPLSRYVLDMLVSVGPAYIGYGVVGFLLVVLWLPAGTGMVSVLLIAAPLFVARWVMVQYSEESRTHEMTVDALVAALEAKDPSCAGHGERVAILAGWIGQELGFPSDQQRMLVLSARLHDIGRVTLSPHQLWPNVPPEGRALRALARHAEASVELVRGIRFLAPALEGIRHHHERFDGRGYPDGLAGEEIPLSARIIAAADAFDALTCSAWLDSRLDSHSALAVLQNRCGSHLDPLVVECLGLALRRGDWPPERHPPAHGEPDWVGYDHDDPAMSDWYAAQVAPMPVERR
jgi:HD-GYP domain-containing protein (c-di-GMP phosphodiesterase class II)